MQNDILVSLSKLSDTELVARVRRLVSHEREATAQIVAHLAELDTRDVHLREGYSSLFVYCRDALGLSEWEAYNRIEVARAARRFPVILDLLADGSVHLTAVRLLAPHLTPENHRDVLESARGKRKVEVQEIVARLAPRPDVPASVRRIPETEVLACPAAPPDPGLAVEAPTYTNDGEATARVVPVPDRAAPVGAVTPLSAGRYKRQVTIGGATLDKLRRAKDMLGHAVPSGEDEAVIDRALDALLLELARKRYAATTTPRRSRGPRRGARQPSAAVKRAVWARDLGQCAYTGPEGHRCRERRFLEFHHVDPYALGGEPSVDGISLRCRRHNDYEGRLYFGKRRPAGKGELVPEQVDPVSSSSANPSSEVSYPG